MQGETGERWRKLCEQAAVEQDPDKLIKLIREIAQLLEMKEQRLKRPPQDSETGVSHQVTRPV
jgi:hypothetical protein